MIVVHVEKGGLGEGGLPRVWHRLTPSVSPPEHVFMSCTSAAPYFLSSLVNYDHLGGESGVELGAKTQTMSPRQMHCTMHMHMHMRVKFRGQIVPFVTGPYEVHLPTYEVLLYTSRSRSIIWPSRASLTPTWAHSSRPSFQAEGQGTRDKGHIQAVNAVSACLTPVDCANASASFHPLHFLHHEARCV